MTVYQALAEMREEEEDMARGWIGRTFFIKSAAQRIKAINIAMDNLPIAEAEKEID